MGALIGFSNPTVLINNIPVNVLPNTFKCKIGKGEKKVRALVAGGNSTVSVVTIDSATKIGEVEFEVAVTPDALQNYSNWSDLIGQLAISAVQTGFGLPFQYQNMTLTNEPDFEGTADGKVKFEFKGDPAVGF